MELVFAYLARVLTLVNRCVLPVRPIVPGGSLQTDARVPVTLTAGLGLSFVVLATGVAALGPAFGIYPEDVTRIAAPVMVGFGGIMVVPALGQCFATVTGGAASATDADIGAVPRGIGAPFDAALSAAR